MHKHEFNQVKRQTKQSVGKFDFERIVGRHALLCIDILMQQQNSGDFEKGIAWSSIQTEWEECILLNMFVDNEGKDFEFEKAVRKVIRNFFNDCVSILRNQAPRKGGNDAKHVALYAANKRSIVDIQRMISEYKQALRLLSEHKSRSDETFYIYGVSLLYAANRLGYFLDMEMSK